MKLHLPHPRRTAQQRRAREQARVRQAVARSGLRSRTPLGWDWEQELRRQRGQRWTR